MRGIRRRFVGSNIEQQPKTLFRYIPYLTAPSYTVYTLASPHSDLHKKFPRKAKKEFVGYHTRCRYIAYSSCEYTSLGVPRPLGYGIG